MASTIKVNNIQNQCGANIANKCGSTVTLGASGDTITLACGASQTGFGRTGTVDWDTTAKTASFTAVSGNGYFVNTTSGAITVTLPAGSAGDIVGISDYASTFQTNNVTITPNGTDKINGVNDNAILSTQGIAVSLVYVDATRGWKSVTGSDNDTTGNAFINATGGTITTCGNFKIHTFTSPGTFCVSAVALCSANNEVSYVVVAGGAGGGGSSASGDSAGGGGAGGFRESKSGVDCYSASPLEGSANVTVTATAFPITVGGGGSGGLQPGQGANGSNSVFSTITSAGGGGGGTFPSPYAGLSGGSGGGGAGGNPNTPGSAPGGAGNTPPVSPPQGNPGGCASDGPLNVWGGGGGGATQAGTNACAYGTLGDGGDGGQTSISGSATYYAGGGGGGATPGRPTVGGAPGGLGGGGPGAGPIQAGTANTGGGGGGGDNTCGGAGGSGIVIIRYKYR